MSFAMELSPAGFDEMLVDLAGMDNKTGRAFLRLCGYLRRFGSVPSGERAFASILGVTVRFLHERAWPLLEDRLELSADGQRYFDPEITGVRSRRQAGQTAPAAQEKSQRHKEAADARWARTPRPTHPGTDAQTHALSMQPDAKTHENSMRGASEMNANASPNASEVHPDASTLAGADSLSKEDSSPSNTSENPALERESADATRMRADASSDASTHSPRMQTDASAHASEARKGGSTRVLPAPLPDAWKPSGEAEVEAKRIGADLEEEVRKFRADCRSKAVLSADWDASFFVRLRRFAEYTERHRQTHLTMAVTGGKTEAPPAAPEEDLDPAAAKLKLTFGGSVYRSWLRHMTIGAVDEDGALLVTLPTAFQRDHIRQHYGDRLTALWQAENPNIRRVVLEVAAPERRAADG